MADADIVDRLQNAEAHVKYLDDVANKLHDRVSTLDPDAKLGSSENMGQTLAQMADSLSQRIGVLEAKENQQETPSTDPIGDGCLADAGRKKAQLEHSVASLSRRVEGFVTEYAKLEQAKMDESVQSQLEAMADSLSARIKSLESGPQEAVPASVESVEKTTRALESLATDLENRLGSLEQTPRTPRSLGESPRNVASPDAEALRSKMMMQIAEANKIKAGLDQLVNVFNTAATSPADAMVLKSRCEALEREISELKKLPQPNSELEAKLQDLQSKLNAAELQASQSQKEIGELRTSLNRQSDQPPQQNKELEAKVQDLQSKLNAAELQATQSQKEIGELRTSLSRQSDQPLQQNKELEAIVQDLQSKLNAATQDLEAMAMQLRQVQQESADAQYKNQLLLQEKSESADLIAKLQNQQREQQSVSSQMAEEEKRVLQQQVDSYQAAMTTFERQSEELQQTTMQAQLEAKEAKNIVQEEAVYKEKILEENARLRANSDVDSQTVAKLQAENLELNNRLNSATSDTTQLEELRQSYDLLKLQYKALEAENGRLITEASENLLKASASARKLESPVVQAVPVQQPPRATQAVGPVSQVLNEFRTQNRPVVIEARTVEQASTAPSRRTTAPIQSMQAQSVIIERPTYGNVVESLERPTYGNVAQPWFSTRSSAIASSTGIASLGFGVPLSGSMGNSPGRVLRPDANVLSSSSGARVNTLAGRPELEVIRSGGSYEATSVAPLVGGPPRSLKLSPYK